MEGREDACHNEKFLTLVTGIRPSALTSNIEKGHQRVDARISKKGCPPTTTTNLKAAAAPAKATMPPLETPPTKVQLTPASPRQLLRVAPRVTVARKLHRKPLKLHSLNPSPNPQRQSLPLLQWLLRRHCPTQPLLLQSLNLPHVGSTRTLCRTRQLTIPC